MTLLTADPMVRRVHSGETSRGSACRSSPPLGAEWALVSEGVQTMRTLLEVTSDGDIVEDGETYALFAFDPESLGEGPIE